VTIVHMAVVLLSPLLLGLVVHPMLHSSQQGSVLRTAVKLQADDEGMPAELGAWGCDEELWSKIRGAKGSLRKLAREGDETAARKRISSIRKLVGEEEANPEAAAAKQAAAAEAKMQAALAKKEQTVETKDQRKEKFTNPRTADAKGSRPLKAGYELYGSLPADFDGEAAKALVKARQEAKIARDFEAADGLQEKLAGMGVRLDDRRRTWSVPAK